MKASELTSYPSGSIGIFNDSFPPILDGVTLTVQNYVDGFTRRGLDTVVVTPWNPVSVPSPCPVLRYFSLPIHSRAPYRYGYPKLDPIIWRRLRHIPFSLLHSHCPFSSGRLAVYVKKRSGVPLIGTFHSKYRSDLEHSFKYTPWMVPIIMRRILDFFNACDEVWIPQGAVAETVREYGYHGPLTVVDNGNDMADGTPLSESDRAMARRETGVPPGAVALLFVGQHIREKGIFVIVEALRRLREQGVAFKMNFIGNGYAINALRSRVAALGMDDAVSIHGRIDDRRKLRRIYAASDLFLFPSFYDNAPLVVREAAAYGVPSILPVGSTAAEVITDGVNGFLSPGDGDSYARIIVRLAKDIPAVRRVGDGARHSLIRNWDDVVDEILDRYRSLIKRCSR